MEDIDKIKNFLEVEVVGSGYGYGYGYGDGSGDGSGYGPGSGYGSGSGYGYGSGSGSGDGDGDGYGDGYGYGDGSGYGYGYGDGSGYGSGPGSGYGSGYGYGSGSGSGDGSGYGIKIKEYKGELVWYVDGIPTLIDKIRGSVAKGRIININDFTVEETFIIKGSNKFAHGSTLKQAKEDLESKIFEDLDIDARIEEFTKEFNGVNKYLGQKFYDWHHRLTGSCIQGRDNFVYSNNLSLTKKYSVQDFIKLTENSYEGFIIKKLKPFYEKFKEQR